MHVHLMAWFIFRRDWKIWWNDCANKLFHMHVTCKEQSIVINVMTTLHFYQILMQLNVSTSKKKSISSEIVQCMPMNGFNISEKPTKPHHLYHSKSHISSLHISIEWNEKRKKNHSVFIALLQMMEHNERV